jgi:hypothetical protein
MTNHVPIPFYTATTKGMISYKSLKSIEVTLFPPSRRGKYHLPSPALPGKTMVSEEEKQDEDRAVGPSEGVETARKTAAFHLSFFALLIMVFIVSLDTTTLAVALPVVRGP